MHVTRCLVSLSVALLSLLVAACPGPPPFSRPSPELAALEEEEPVLYAEPEAAEARLAQTNLPDLPTRIGNLYDAYEGELRNAERAQGGAANALLSITSVLVPLGGTVSAVALSKDDAATVAGITAGVTTALVAINLLFKPGQKAAAAKRCEDFLRSALETLSRRWDRDNLGEIQGTREEWVTYLAVRGSLDAGKSGAC